METYLGMDFGGTKLLVGEVDATGHIIGKKSYTTGYVNQQAAVDIIKSSLSDYLRSVGTGDRRPAAVGIGMIGRVDTEHGQWLQIDPLRSYSFDLAAYIRASFGLPCYLSNDVKGATCAEQYWGHGCNSKNFVYINIGTGIAAGTVIDGRQTIGSHFNAGEVGHTQVGVHTGVKCTCGRIDCVEAIASGSGFDTCARMLYTSYPDTKLILPGTDVRIDVREIYALARTGDSLCLQLVDNAALAIANLIMNLVRVTDPDTVVLGGGIVSDPYMYDKIISHLHPGTMRFVTNGVVLTRLDPAHIGLLGAAAIAMTQLKNTI
ncbi:MAG: ROK family protein [Alistipes sp.]|nr:ROK family protein [Alistipes sp.]